MNPRRQAPVRDVIDRRRIGTQAHVRWQHELSCGHIEERKRRLKGPVKCTTCVGGDYDPADDIELARTRALLASRLGVPHESIQLSGAGASVWLSKKDVIRITRKATR